MATPTTKMMTSGYRKNPPSWKNLMIPLTDTLRLLGKTGVLEGASAPRLRYIRFKNCESLLRLVCGRRGTWLQRFEVAVLSAKYVTVDRLEHLVEQAVHRAPDEIAEFCTAPGHDVQHLGQLAVTGDLRGLEVAAILGVALGRGLAARVVSRGARGGPGRRLLRGGLAGRGRRLGRGRRRHRRGARRRGVDAGFEIFRGLAGLLGLGHGHRGQQQQRAGE